MEKAYPQETIGVTLVLQEDRGELRRVFMRWRSDFLEVGEFSKGPVTDGVYGSPVHLHCAQLRGVQAEALAQGFFLGGSAFLADFLDELDRLGVPYGYLSTVLGDSVAFRPFPAERIGGAIVGDTPFHTQKGRAMP